MLQKYKYSVRSRFRALNLYDIENKLGNVAFPMFAPDLLLSCIIFATHWDC